MTLLSARFARWLLAAAPVAALPTALPAQDTTVTRASFLAVPARLVNLGVRGTLGVNETLISGFYITEGTSATVLVRATGPALATLFGVPGAMANPKLEIFDATGHVVAANDDWSPDTPPSTADNLTWSVPQAGQMVGAFPLPTASRDAAIVVTLKPGSYTLVISGSSSADTGVVLGEIYHLPTLDSFSASNSAIHTPSKVTNLSARGRIVNADSVMIGSFVVGGSVLPLSGSSGVTLAGDRPSKRFLIRVVGPGLVPYGVTDALVDPVLELKGNNGVAIQMNDNWDADPEAARLLRETAASVGAFPLEPGSRDAVAIARLPEGAYSVIARGANGATGTVLIEIYELPD